jgi:peptidoglycan hydrolase-like protein with peptidoglycan-binding domain
MSAALPLVFNDNPSNLVQLTMNGSVGIGGDNIWSDVILVQTLLNLIAPNQNQPQSSLAVDGIVGPMTIGAIIQYQSSNTPIVDGLVDVNGPTIISLVRAAVAQNQLPSLLNFGPPSQQIVDALTGEGSTLAATPTGTIGLPPPPFSRTGWSIASSGGFDVSVGPFGFTLIHIYMQHDTEPGVTHQLTFAGFGVGLSGLPIGLDIAFQEMRSFGSDVRTGGIPLLARNPPFDVNEFNHQLTTVMSVSANVGPGAGGTIFFFGPLTALASNVPGGQALTATYLGGIVGLQVGLPGASIAMYAGAITGVT